jgi:hypothetical protein
MFAHKSCYVLLDIKFRMIYYAAKGEKAPFFNSAKLL